MALFLALTMGALVGMYYGYIGGKKERSFGDRAMTFSALVAGFAFTSFVITPVLVT